MSDYLDIVQSALDKGILLDSCGSDERQKWWGLYNDLCGMSVEDAMAVQYYHGGGGGGEDEKKKKNTITFVMQTDGSEYSLYLTAANAPTSDMLVSFTMDGEQKIVTFPAGVKSFNTGFKASNGYKYATISNINVAGDDEKYTYTTDNTVKDGYFKLTIVNDGVQSVESIFYDTPVDLPSKPEKAGYDFVWRNSKGEVITSFNMPEQDTKIVGKYEAKEYTVNYVIYEEYAENESNETLPKKEYKSGEITFKYDSKILSALNNLMPNRTGYTNAKWTDNAGTEITSATTMTESITSVSATYQLNKYTLTCYVDETVWNLQEKYFGTEIETVTEPTKTGYNFSKWSTEIPTTMPANNIDTYAVFEAIPYYIIYKVDGEEKYREEHIYGDAITLRANEEKIGYTFSGWDTVLGPTMPDNDIEINGYFTINEYTITYMVDGDEYSAETYEYGADVTPLDEPEKEGHTFSGWDKTVPAKMPAENLTISGVFAINYYKVRYYISGETALVGEQEYAYGELITPIAGPTREGYTFDGWGEYPTEGMPAHDVDVFGSYTVNQYTITYYVDGEEYSTETLDFGAPISKVEDPEKEGYTFVSWDKEIPATMPAEDLEIVADFSINSYTISYYVNDEIEPRYVDTFVYGETVNIRPDERQEGYTFSGWTSEKEIPETMPAENIILYGVLVVNQYTLTYNVDGEYYDSQIYDFGSTIIPINDPEEIGHTFSGWRPELPKTMPAENITVNGDLTINKHKLTFAIEGYPETSSTVEYGAELAPLYPTIEEPEGYKLSWDKDAPETMPDEDLTINGTLVEKKESTEVYYGLIFDKDIDSLDAETIKALPTKYDGATTKTQEVVHTIPEDPEYNALCDLRDNAETEEEYAEYEAMVDEYRDEHLYAGLFIIPQSVELDDILNELGKSVLESTPIVKTLIIDDTAYDIRVRTGDTWCVMEYDESNYKFTIKLK